MSETDEEKQKRWAQAAKYSYRTPAMEHFLTMSKQQSNNTYKADYDKNKGRGFTQVSITPELENVKRQTHLASTNTYKKDFEKNKGKFTQVADDPTTRHVSKVGNQISNIAYTGKGSAVSKSYKSTRSRFETKSTSTDETKKSPVAVRKNEVAEEVPVQKEAPAAEATPQALVEETPEEDDVKQVETAAAVEENVVQDTAPVDVVDQEESPSETQEETEVEEDTVEEVDQKVEEQASEEKIVQEEDQASAEVTVQEEVQEQVDAPVDVPQQEETPTETPVQEDTTVEVPAQEEVQQQDDQMDKCPVKAAEKEEQVDSLDDFYASLG